MPRGVDQQHRSKKAAGTRSAWTAALPRRALCHEWLTTYGGSEQVARRISQALDIDDIYAFAVDDDLAERLFPNKRVRVAHALGATAFARRYWQWFLPAMPYGWAHLDLDDYDLVITSSHAAVNAIRTRPDTVHITYCHTPMRYAWDWRAEIRRFPVPLRPMWPAAAAAFRRADRRWAERVTHFIANSRHVAEKIRRCYGRRATILHPPIDTSFWTPNEQTKDDFFLFAGRLVPYKRAEVAVKAAGAARVPLVVAGSGPDLSHLKSIAGPTIDFVENPPDEELRALYRRARALVFPGVEDFGMTLVEAQACGTPVIALASGGALEAVSGETGLLYQEPTVQGLVEALRRFDPDDYEPRALRSHAETFSPDRFDEGLKAIVAEVLSRQ